MKITFLNGRRRFWRWLIVVEDLPPLPPYAECMEGYFTKRSAERAWRMTRFYYRAAIRRETVAIHLVKASEVS